MTTTSTRQERDVTTRGETPVAALWRRYLADRDRAARQALILHYSPLVNYTVGRMLVGLPLTVERDDLLGYGTIGLIQAMEKYDPQHQTKFETFAQLRIRGAIIDSLRQQDWMPRPLRQQSKQVERAMAELETRLGRSATEQELARELGMDRADLQKLLASTNHQLTSLEDCLAGSEGSPIEERLAGDEARSPYALCESSERIEQLALALERLPERERLLMSLYYFEELTMKEIAHILGVSEPRVCQLHSQAIKRLRVGMARQPLATAA